jgi:hypothetical protein
MMLKLQHWLHQLKRNLRMYLQMLQKLQQQMQS